MSTKKLFDGPLPGNYDERRITELVKKYRKYDKQLAETRALEGRLKEEIKSLTRTVNLTDESAMSTLNTKRTQLSFIPARISEIEDAMKSMHEELEASELFNCCSTLFAQELDRKIEEIIKVVLPFCNEPETGQQDALYLAHSTSVVKNLKARMCNFAGNMLGNGPCFRARMALQVIHEYRVRGRLDSRHSIGGIEGDPPELAA